MGTKESLEKKLRETKAELKAHKRIFREELEDVAFDIRFDGRDYYKVLIQYNLETMQGRIIENKKIADTKAVALLRCKELVSRKLLLDENWDGKRKKKGE